MISSVQFIILYQFCFRKIYNILPILIDELLIRTYRSVIKSCFPKTNSKLKYFSIVLLFTMYNA